MPNKFARNDEFLASGLFQTNLMTKLFFRPLLLSNYSLAVAITGWKAEKIFPRAILTTSLQFYFLLSAALIFIHPKVKTIDEFWFLAGELAVAGFIVLVMFRPFITWLFMKLNILSQYKVQGKVPPRILPGIVFSALTMITLAAAIAFEFSISVP